jgi:membrane-bound lytic murein transglycosylase D
VRATNWRIEAVTALGLVLAVFFIGCAGSKHEPKVVSKTAARGQEPAPSSPASGVEEEDVAGLEPPPATAGNVAEVPADGEEPDVPDEEAQPGEEVSEAPHDELLEVPGAVPKERLAEERALVEETAATFDIPMVVNDRVVFWLDFYSNRKRDFFRAGLERSGKHLERFQAIFREAGLPEDLVYLAHVESAFKTTAYSRAKARGIFQFIASTGRRYGLRIDGWVDERADPEKSARAAAAYLKDLYAEFGDWYLALASYNAGEGRIRSAIRRSGSRDFWRIAGTRYIRRETKNYVPAILAATMLAKDPEKHGLTYTPEPQVIYDTIAVEGAVDLQVLSRCGAFDIETLRQLNPALRRGQTPPGTTTALRVPPGTGATMLAALALVPPGERLLYVRHVVRRGDTLSVIAGRYGVSVGDIQLANRMGRRTTIHVGQELTIPTASGNAAELARSAPAPIDAAVGEPMRYRVRRGDTLSAIARRFDTTPQAIASRNRIGVRSTIRVGQTLTVVPGVRSVSAQASSAPIETTTDVPPSTPQPMAQAAAEAAPPTAPETELPTVHTVRRGETLTSIAERYGTTAHAIARTNGRNVRQVLHVGDRLKIAPPAARMHTVRRGDSLWDIAQLYATTIENLCAWNAISRSAPLLPGMRLTVAVE